MIFSIVPVQIQIHTGLLHVEQSFCEQISNLFDPPLDGNDY